MIVEAILAGVAAGLFGALVGLGGGVILVPLLILIMDMPLTTAVAASLVGVVATALGGSAMFIRDGHTDRPLAVRAAGVAMAGALVGARAAVQIPEGVLKIAFAFLLAMIVWRMLRKRTDTTTDASPASPWLAGGLFAGAGVVAGMLGVGGGVLNVPALHLALKRPMVTAVATSTLIIAFTAAAGAATYAALGYVEWPLAAGCATGAFIGGRLGAFLSSRVPVKFIRSLFIAVLIYVAVEMFARGAHLPWWR